MIRWG